MELIIDWIKQIILIILFAIVLEMLLPSSEFKRYAKIVVSLILILTIIQPVLSLFRIDTNKILSSITNPSKKEEISLGEKVNTKKNEIVRIQSESISKQMGINMKKIIADELASKFKLTIISLDVSMKEDKASVFVTVGDVTNDEVQVKQPLKPVSIDVQIQNENIVDSEEKEDVIAFLAKSWNVEKVDIKLTWK